MKFSSTKSEENVLCLLFYHYVLVESMLDAKSSIPDLVGAAFRRTDGDRRPMHDANPSLHGLVGAVFS